MNQKPCEYVLYQTIQQRLLCSVKQKVKYTVYFEKGVLVSFYASESVTNAN